MSVASTVNEKKNIYISVTMILALFTVDIDHHATVGASLKENRNCAGNL